MKTHLLAMGVVAVLALGGAAAALAIRSVPTKTTVTVTEREYRVLLSTKTPPAGLVRFVVHNTGHVAHALSISGPGLATRTTGIIKPGATKALQMTLGGGTYKLWCPLGRHAAEGMKTSLSVKGAPAPPVTGTPTTTTPDPGYGGGDGYGYGY